MKDIESKNKFIELRAKGLSFDKIAQELNISKQTLITWSKELKIEIANLKSIELEVLQEKFYISKTKRIELFGSQLETLKNELGKRDLSQVGTEKLFELSLKYGAFLKEEAEPITFKETLSAPDIDWESEKVWTA